MDELTFQYQFIMKANVVLITIDALRRDHLGCYGYDKGLTPNLDRLACKGALFGEAISNSPHTPTSFIALFSSRYPGMLPEKGRMRAADRPSLVDILKESGYATGAFTDSNPYLSHPRGYGRSYDVFEDFIEYSSRNMKDGASSNSARAHTPRFGRQITRIGASVQRHPYVRFPTAVVQRYILGHSPFQTARKVTERAIPWLEKQTHNWYLWVHYMDAHMPYVAPNTFVRRLKWLPTLLRYGGYNPERMPKTALEPMISLYDGGIRHIDLAIGDLLKKLDSLNILDDTFTIITADHGEEFGEHGKWASHGYQLYDELLRVPLIITGPGIQPREVNDQVELIDVAPTILDLLGIAKPVSFCGASLVPLINGAESEKERTAISEFFSRGRRGISLRHSRWKYIALFDSAGTQMPQEELYDLQNDPLETSNIINIEIEKGKEFRSHMFHHIAREEAHVVRHERDSIRSQIGRLRERENT